MRKWYFIKPIICGRIVKLVYRGMRIYIGDWCRTRKVIFVVLLSSSPAGDAYLFHANGIVCMIYVCFIEVGHHWFKLNCHIDSWCMPSYLFKPYIKSRNPDSSITYYNISETSLIERVTSDQYGERCSVSFCILLISHKYAVPVITQTSSIKFWIVTSLTGEPFVAQHIKL